MRRLGDGRILVVDEGVDEIRLYSSSGRFIGGAGRTGEGPGEFAMPISAQPFRGDSIAVWDFWLRRLTVLDSALEVGRVSRLPSPDLHSIEGEHILGVFRDTLDVQHPQVLPLSR
ncbi:MAG: hypothetical protein RQ745_13410 [Longimicrobiales bacterium]|nr:hypothetical protein [Longimicrobiales bacterium]